MKFSLKIEADTLEEILAKFKSGVGSIPVEQPPADGEQPPPTSSPPPASQPTPTMPPSTPVPARPAPPPNPAPIPTTPITSVSDFKSKVIGVQPKGALVDIRGMPSFMRGSLAIAPDVEILNVTLTPTPFAANSILGVVMVYLPDLLDPPVDFDNPVGEIQSSKHLAEIESWLREHAAQPKFQ